MKKISCILVLLLLLSLFTGCGSAKPSGDLVIFAAASMTEVLPQLTAKYQEKYPDLSPTFNFESSGKLKTQIQEGADCDIFISAAPKQMNQLDISRDAEKNPERLDFVATETRFDLLENKVVLVAPAGNPKGIHSFDELAKGLADETLLLVVGGPDVPVGQYTQSILAYYKLDEAELAEKKVISYGDNVKAVTTQVTESLADCGIIYATDAKAAGLEALDAATKEMCGQVIYPAAMLKNAKNPDAARSFLEWLKTSEEAAAILEQAGFSPLR